MASKTTRILRSLGRFGAVGAGIAASIAATVVVVKASAKPKQTQTVWSGNAFPCDNYTAVKKWNFNWDGLQFGDTGVWSPPPKSTSDMDKACDEGFCDSPTEESVPKARRNIILVRHGQYNQDGLDIDDGHTLTSLGQEQAAFVGKKLDTMGVKFSSITSSGMIRAKQTACTLLKNMKTQCHLKLDVNDPILNEGCPCVPEPPYRRLDVWNPCPREVMTDGSRIETAFRKYFYRADPSQEEDSWEIIVCHGNVIRYFSCRALQFPPEGWLRIAIDHCSITRLTILPTGEVTLRSLGDSGHIPYEKTTV